MAKYLNKARNKAAHSHNSTDIYKQLGFSGDKAFKHSKEKCLEILENLISVKI